jgi:hypothetical protein
MTSSRELFAEACGIDPKRLVPSSLLRTMELFNKFCLSNQLNWHIGPGESACYECVVWRDDSDWEIASECCNLSTALMDCVAMAYSNIKQTHECRVLDFNHFKNKLRSNENVG